MNGTRNAPPLARCARFILCIATLGAFLGAPLLRGQEVTRQDEWRALREKKAGALTVRRPGGIERSLLWLQERKLLEKLDTPGAGLKGFRPRLGGFNAGSGFAFGVQYDRPRLAEGRLDFSVAAVTSTRAYQFYELKLSAPRLYRQHLFVQGAVRYRNLPQEDYFGLGPDSLKTSRTNYRYEEAAYELTAGVRPIRRLQVGGGLSRLQVNVGPGTDRRFASTEKLFAEADSPGLSQQTFFLRSELFAHLDTRDAPGNPGRGGSYRAAVTHYNDTRHDRFDFWRYEAEWQQYIPFNHGHRVIAFRFQTSFDDAARGHEIPFYLQRSLGGAYDLRGFREFRFRDRNQMVFNLEYRWQAWIGLDMALFGDAGKVFRNRRDFHLRDLEGAFGIGFRFNTARSVFWRIDLSHSREGLRPFIQFRHVF